MKAFPVDKPKQDMNAVAALRRPSQAWHWLSVGQSAGVPWDIDALAGCAADGAGALIMHCRKFCNNTEFELATRSAMSSLRESFSRKYAEWWRQRRIRSIGEEDS